MTEEETLIRQAVTDEANQAVDAATVLAGLREARPKRRRTGMLVAVAGFAVAAAVVAVVVPLTASREATPVPPASAPNKPVPVTAENILLVGLDEVDNTDTIILVRHNADGTFRAVSIPRDTYVDIPGQGQHKISSAYPRGAADGMKSLVGAVQELTGVTVNHYAAVKMADFVRLADAVGGVEVCLKGAVKDTLSNANFPAGKQTLAGDALLAFLRQRHGLPNGDLDRVVRAQVFLRSLVNKVAGSTNLPALVEAVKQTVRVDPGWDLVEFANQVASGATTVSGTIPYANGAKQTNEGDVIAVDPAKVKDFTGKFLAGSGSPAQDATCVW
jgi:LCP family protein required for cell wall assembly